MCGTGCLQHHMGDLHPGMSPEDHLHVLPARCSTCGAEGYNGDMCQCGIDMERFCSAKCMNLHLNNVHHQAVELAFGVFRAGRVVNPSQPTASPRNNVCPVCQENIGDLDEFTECRECHERIHLNCSDECEFCGHYHCIECAPEYDHDCQVSFECQACENRYHNDNRSTCDFCHQSFCNECIDDHDCSDATACAQCAQTHRRADMCGGSSNGAIRYFCNSRCALDYARTHDVVPGIIAPAPMAVCTPGAVPGIQHISSPPHMLSTEEQQRMYLGTALPPQPTTYSPNQMTGTAPSPEPEPTTGDSLNSPAQDSNV